MIYNIASDIDTKRIVWIAQEYQTQHSSVEVSTVNRKMSEDKVSNLQMSSVV